jgi:hypothetical protein
MRTFSKSWVLDFLGEEQTWQDQKDCKKTNGSHITLHQYLILIARFENEIGWGLWIFSAAAGSPAERNEYLSISAADSHSSLKIAFLAAPTEILRLLRRLGRSESTTHRSMDRLPAKHCDLQFGLTRGLSGHIVCPALRRTGVMNRGQRIISRCGELDEQVQAASSGRAPLAQSAQCVEEVSAKAIVGDKALELASF